MRRLAIAIAALCAVTAFPAHAETGNGCEVIVATGAPRGNCRYFAAGPGTYAVASPFPWRIEVSKDRGLTWTPFAGSTVLVNAAPIGRAWRPATGSLPTVSGDLVNLSIAPEVFCTNNPPADPPCSVHQETGVGFAGDM